MKKEAEKVDDFWSDINNDFSKSEVSFYSFPPIKSRSCKMIFGETDASREDWCQYWTVEKFLKDHIPFEKALSICCGFGSVERQIAKLNVAKKIVGTDIAQGAINVAADRAKKEGLNNIEYFVSDINEHKLPENEYDLIWANGALHHIKNLDFVIKGLYKSLKPGGFLIANEYIGPNYQQVGYQQQVFINALQELMPKELLENQNLSAKGKVKKQVYKLLGKNRRYKPLSLEWFLKNDPSEGVNSEQIIPVLNSIFDQVEVKSFGGTIIFYAFNENFYKNFDRSNAAHRNFLELAFKYEDALLDSGILSPDNAHIICRKRV